ncbi:MAG TPA: hypothetical protein ENK46_05135 [Flavobacteriia bacterium]|nr:hypothetical protein [Flavobacteriia bacterium]
MKIQKFTLAILFLLFISQTLFSQEFTIPKNVTLKSDSDYKKYENDVLQGINWLENTPINQQVAKRKKVSAFLLQWMTGTPSFSIKMQSFQMELTEKNPDLLISFLGGWAKYALENPADKDNELAANIAGFESLIKVYTSNKENGIKKDKKVEKLAKLDKTGLEKWVRKKLGQ